MRRLEPKPNRLRLHFRFEMLCPHCGKLADFTNYVADSGYTSILFGGDAKKIIGYKFGCPHCWGHIEVKDLDFLGTYEIGESHER